MVNDLNIGRVIFENVPDNLKPFWSGLILSRFNNYLKNTPDSINELYPIIESDDRWTEAHAQFSKIRQLILDNKYDLPESFLILADKTAKVTYNASFPYDPFDANSGWYISSLALETVSYFGNDRLKEEVEAIVLLFSRNKKFKIDIQAVKEFLIYRKIDKILWFDWNPIGLDDARDEYTNYVPETFRLKKMVPVSKKLPDIYLKLRQSEWGSVEQWRTV